VEILGVSRPTLRQALKGLQLLGIIRSRQGAGSYLSESTGEMLRLPLDFAIAFGGNSHNDLFETRQVLEVKLAALAADRRTDEDLKNMYTALAGMKISKGHPDRYCEYGLQLHTGIAQASKNSVLISIVEMLSGLLMESRKQSVCLLVNYEDSYMDHQRIVLCIERKDATGASLAMTQHFRSMETRANETERSVLSAQ
jgi:GntR family transcriptional repressor for pyruvate dehydrogenase complex